MAHIATPSETYHFNRIDYTMMSHCRTLLGTLKHNDLVTLDKAEYDKWNKDSVKASIRTAARELGLEVTFRGDTFRVFKY